MNLCNQIKDYKAKAYIIATMDSLGEIRVTMVGDGTKLRSLQRRVGKGCE